MSKVIIFGAKDFEKRLKYYIDNFTNDTVSCFCVDKEYLQYTKWCNCPVVSTEKLESLYHVSCYKVLVGIGYKNMNEVRKEKCKEFKEKGYELYNLIHRDAFVDPSVKMGGSNIILAKVVIDYNVEIGEGNIVEIGTNIAHECKIGNYNYVSPGVVLGGKVRMKDCCFLGLNSTIRSAITLNDKVLVGAGAFVNETVLAEKVLVPHKSKELNYTSKEMNIMYREDTQYRILIICGGRHQVPIIKKAHELGYCIVNTNMYENSEGFEFADYHEVIDVKDIRANVECVKKYGIQGVVSEQNELSVHTVACVAEQCGLLGITEKVANLYLDKYKMREFCRNRAFAYPQYRKVTTVEQALNFWKKNNSKLIMKPNDSNSSKGVVSVYSEADILENFDDSLSNSSCKELILEEYIEGKEFTVDALVLDGKVYNLAISRKKHFFHNENIARELYFSYSDEEYDYNLLRDWNQRIIEASGLKFGLTHSEYKYSYSKKQFVLIEMAARGGGANIATLIVPYISGVDNYKYYLKYAVGEEIKDAQSEIYYQIEKNKNKCALLKFIQISEVGKIVKRIIGNEQIATHPNVAYFELNIQSGDVISEVICDSNRLGYYIIIGDSRNEINSVEEYINCTLKIEVE